MHKQLMENIAKLDDVDVPHMFREDRQPLKSPLDKDKRRSERIELEDSYINVCGFCLLMSVDLYHQFIDCDL